MRDRFSNRYVCLIGAQKAGTTSLYQYLATHPAVHAVRWKESKRFLADDPPREDVERFRRLSAGCRPGQWLFETSTYYTKFPQYAGVPERIARSFPEARLLYLVRDPVERIWSQYCHYLAKDWERRPFAEAVRENAEYLDYSRYHLQLQQYLEAFPPERLRVVVLEEFLQEKAAGMRGIFEFLGIDADFVPPNLQERYNDGATKRGMTPVKRAVRSMPGYGRLPWRVRRWMKTGVGPPLPDKREVFTPELRRELAEALQEDAEALFAFLGREVPAWKSLRAQRTA